MLTRKNCHDSLGYHPLNQEAKRLSAAVAALIIKGAELPLCVALLRRLSVRQTLL
jgi:hypothetical protein